MKKGGEEAGSGGLFQIAPVVCSRGGSGGGGDEANIAACTVLIAAWCCSKHSDRR